MSDALDADAAGGSHLLSKLGRRLSVGEVRFHEESDRGSTDSGVWMALWRFDHWRSLEDTVEGRMLEESGIQFYCTLTFVGV